jgi:pSer/pThr/pTyr-binding forkhead associated (FHA) protein
MIDAKLVLVGDRQKPTVIKLKKLPMTVGRGKEADLTLAHPMVSRLHCELYEVEGTLCIRDMGSLNGTYVGDIRITEASLESGDLLTIGEATFKVVVGEGSSEEALMPPGVDEPIAEDEEGIEFTTADDSFIEMSDSLDDDKASAADQPAAEQEPVAEETGDNESAEKQDAEKEPAGKKGAEKKKRKGQAEAATIAFEPPDDEPAEVDTGDDDDLQDFLAGLK